MLFEVYVDNLDDLSLTKRGEIGLLEATLTFAGKDLPAQEVAALYHSSEELLPGMMGALLAAHLGDRYMGFGPHDYPGAPENADHFIFVACEDADAFAAALSEAGYLSCVYPHPSFEDAVAILAGTQDGDKYTAVEIIHAEVAALVESGTGGEGETSLFDWLYEGTGWEVGKTTAQALADEWDALAEDA